MRQPVRGIHELTYAGDDRQHFEEIYLEDEVRDEERGFVLGQMVVLVTERNKQELEILQSLHQDAGVGIEEAQGEPLQD